MNPPQPDGELRILIGGSIEECIGEVFAKMIEKSFGYLHVHVRIFEDLREFLEAAAQSPPDLFLVYLYFGDPADEAITDPATSRTEIYEIISDATDDQACFVTTCGLRIVTCLRAEFGKPVIVLTGCGNAPGRATAVEQAGGSALLLLPCDTAECAAAIGICIQRNSNISQ